MGIVLINIFLLKTVTNATIIIMITKSYDLMITKTRINEVNITCILYIKIFFCWGYNYDANVVA